ncbi:MAG: hypothetical protein KA313_02535 [Pseudarcicella sp.]|nr:hypothetical protein [Pseudarcicella sp.]MBP6409956.1 hypothetical protein [Pseudarcicella sp.]
MNGKDYFQNYQDYFWEWEENAEVISIPNGSTVAYTDALIEPLKTISAFGLPPFGSFLLTIIATNITADDSLLSVYKIINDKHATFFTPNIQHSFETGFKFLNVLQLLPKEYKIGKRRNILLQTIFKNSHNRINHSTASGIALFLDKGNHKKYDLSPIKLNYNVLTRDFKTLELLHEKFLSTEAIIQAMGELPELERDLLPELESKTILETSYKDFVEELISNEKTFQIGALIKPIWAGFKIPIFNANPSEQPMGGVSDLSNKGDFDKLLISEFANDDLVLMTRLANNEALYLHREMPPISDKLKRIILIDISLKMWGIPKTLAHATAIAISCHPKSNSQSSIVLVGDSFEEVNYENILSTIDATQKVSIQLYANQGINEFIHSQKQSKLEIFYITTHDGLKNAETIKILSENYNSFKYLVQVNQEGEIAFFNHKNKAIKHLQSIKLPFEKLWSEKKYKKQSIEIPLIPIDKNGSPPILLPLKSMKNHLQWGRKLYVLENNSLFRMHEEISKFFHKNGAELILNNLTAQAIFELGETSEGDDLFMVFNKSNHEVKITNIQTLETAIGFFPEWKTLHRSAYFVPYIDVILMKGKHNEIYFFTPNFSTKTVTINKHEAINLQNKDDHMKVIYDFVTEYNQNRLESETKPFKARKLQLCTNVKDICIDESKNLRINGFYLSYNGSDPLKLHSKNNIGEKIISSMYDRKANAFVFSDKSVIYINKNGYYTLVSSNENIPKIYIPAVLDFGLGVATDVYFAGNEYFYRIPYLNIHFETIGNKKLKACQIIKEYTSLTSEIVKRYIEDSPAKFSIYMKISDAKKMIQELKEIGCVASFKSNNFEERQHLSTQAFYNNFIQPFIQHIINHGTSI